MLDPWKHVLNCCVQLCRYIISSRQHDWGVRPEHLFFRHHSNEGVDSNNTCCTRPNQGGWPKILKNWYSPDLSQTNLKHLYKVVLIYIVFLMPFGPFLCKERDHFVFVGVSFLFLRRKKFNSSILADWTCNPDHWSLRLQRHPHHARVQVPVLTNTNYMLDKSQKVNYCNLPIF